MSLAGGPASEPGMTPEQLAEIATREQAATPGPWCTDAWEIYRGAEFVPGVSEWIGETCRGTVDGLAQDRADAAFVAGARTDVPALLADNRRLRGSVAHHQDRADALSRQVAAVRRERHAAEAEREALRDELSLSRTAAAYWQGLYLTEAGVTRDPSGDLSCATCRMPVDSEPCAEHSPQARVAALEAELVAVRSVADLATEYRVPGPGGRELVVRRRPGGTTWSVTDGLLRVLEPGGWGSVIDLPDAELYCWPDADAAVAAARRVLGGGEHRG